MRKSVATDENDSDTDRSGSQLHPHPTPTLWVMIRDTSDKLRDRHRQAIPDRDIGVGLE